jgi:hypothetical protein
METVVKDATRGNAVTTFSWDYVAGLFDGEGCIDTQRMYTKGAHGEQLYVRPRLRICLSIVGENLLKSLRAQFGGHLSYRKPQSEKQQASVSWELLSEDDMRKFLVPFSAKLVLKREQANLALWWLDNLKGRQKHLHGDVDAARHAFAEELRAMKRDPQRLSERAEQRILALMRQSDLRSDTETKAETALARAA